jgi:hypothetical protein
MDDEAAEEAMYPRLRATRHLMRQVRRWGTNLETAETDAPRPSIPQRFMNLLGRQKPSQEFKAAEELWSGVVAQAAIIYGQGYNAPGSDQRQTFLKQYPEMRAQPVQLIASLRKLVEPPAQA